VCCGGVELAEWTRPCRFALLLWLAILVVVRRETELRPLWKTAATTPARCIMVALAFDVGDDMPVAKKLSDAEVSERLSHAGGWTLVNGKLHRAFECKDFVTAFGNMTRVALVAEAMDHHPEWFNVWNKVVIDLNSHSVKGISNLDFELAAKIDEIFSA
jgi:4a-hydroxytetrahydrobiopterin dehydratase